MLHPAAPSSSAVPLSLPFGLLCSFFFFSPPTLSSFQEATCSPPFALVTKRFPHLLPITFGCSWLAASHLGQCGVSARSPLPRRHWGREGWRGGWGEAELGGQTWVFFFFFPSSSSSCADAAIRSQETRVEKEGHPWNCDSWRLAQVCFSKGYRGSEEVITRCYEKADLLCRSIS